MIFPAKDFETCGCENADLPPWTGELHGLSQVRYNQYFHISA